MYKITIDGNDTQVAKKDAVIEFLMAQFHLHTDLGIQVVWPDDSSVEYEGVE